MMKGLTATVILFVHAIQCQRRRVPEIINSRAALTSSIGIAVGKGAINLCPDDHAYAFRNGDRCCKSSQDCRGNEINRSSSCCSNDDYVNCQTGGNCENASPPCLGTSITIDFRKYRPLKKGYPSNTAANVEALNNKATTRKRRSAQKQSSKIRSKPQTEEKLELDDIFGDTVILNYRPIFVNSNECVWFDDNRIWRKGACDSVGTQRSNADCLGRQDASCPILNNCFSKNNCNSNSKARAESRGQSCIGIDSTEIGDGVSVTTGSSAASNTYQVQDGRYYSSCTWKKPRGFWRCV